MRQPFVQVACLKDYGRDKSFYFVVNESGIPLPNFCEDYSPCQSCHQCSKNAQSLLIEKLKRNKPFTDPLGG